MDTPLFRIPILTTNGMDGGGKKKRSAKKKTSDTDSLCVLRMGMPQVCLPTSDERMELSIKGKGPMVPTWENDIGLQVSF
jgi:hypothetical protein